MSMTSRAASTAMLSPSNSSNSLPCRRKYTNLSASPSRLAHLHAMSAYCSTCRAWNQAESASWPSHTVTDVTNVTRPAAREQAHQKLNLAALQLRKHGSKPLKILLKHALWKAVRTLQHLESKPLRKFALAALRSLCDPEDEQGESGFGWTVWVDSAVQSRSIIRDRLTLLNYTVAGSTGQLPETCPIVAVQPTEQSALPAMLQGPQKWDAMPAPGSVWNIMEASRKPALLLQEVGSA